MAGHVLETSVEIGGILSPSLQQSITQAINRLNSMSRETLESASAAQRLATQIRAEENVLGDLTQGYASYILEGRESSEEAQRLAREIQNLSGDINSNRERLQAACAAADQLTQEYDHTENEAGELGRSLDELDESSAQANEGFTVFKATLANLASQAISAAAGAVKDFIGDVVSLGREFQATMSEVGAISGASAEDLERLEATARKYGSTTVFSAKEAGEALKYMSLAGWDTEQQIDALGGVLDLAAASGMELGAASDMVTDYLSAFAMEAGESAYFADMLAYAQSASNTSAAQLGEAYKNCAANLNAAGQDVETVTSLLEGMANQGYKGSEAGTALAAMMRDLTKNMSNGQIVIGDTAITVMDAAGNYRDLTDVLAEVNQAVDGMGSAERAMALSTTFTADSTKGLNLLLNEGVDKIAGYEEALRVADGTAAKMAATMNDNLEGDLKNLGSAFDELKLKAYDKIEPLMRKGVQFLTNSVIPAITNIRKYIPQIAVAVSALTAVIGAYKWRSILSFIAKAQGALKGVISALSAVSAPALVVIGAVTAIAAAITHLWNTNAFFRNNLLSTWYSIKRKFNEFGQGITERLNKLGFSFTDISDVIKSAWESFCQFIRPLAEGTFAAIGKTIGTTLDVILGLFDTFSALFSGDWQGAWNGIKNVFKTAWHGITEVFSLETKTLKKGADVFLGWFGTSWDEVWNSVPQPVKDAMSSAGTWISDKLGAAKNWITDTAVPGICDAWDYLAPKVEQAASDAGNWISDKFSAAKTFVTDTVVPGISNAWDICAPAVETAMENARGFISSKMTEAKDFIKNDIVPTVSSAWDTYAPAVQEKFIDIVSSAKLKYEEIRDFIADDIIPAITDKWETIKEKVTEVIGFVSPYVTTAFEDVKEFITGTVIPVMSKAFEDIKSGIGPVIEFLRTEVIPRVQEIAESVMNAVQSAWNFVKTVFNKILPYIEVVFGAVIATVVAVWEVIKAAFEPAVRIIGGAFKAAWEIIKNVWDAASGYFKLIVDNISELFSGISALLEGDFSGAWEAIKNIFKNQSKFFKGIRENALNVLKAIVRFAGTLLKGVWDTLTNLFEPLSTWLTDKVLMPVSDAFTSVWDSITSVVGRAWGTIRDAVGTGITFLVDIATSAFNLIVAPFRLIWESCSSVVTTVWDAIREFIGSSVDKVHEYISGKFSEIKETITLVITTVKAFLETAWNKISEKVSEVWTKIHTSVSNKINAVKSVISNIITKIKDTMSGIWDKISSKVSEIWSNIHNKVTEKTKAVKDTVFGKFQEVYDSVKEKTELAYSKVSEVFGNIRNKINDKVTDAKNIVSDVFQNIFGSIKSKCEDAFNKVSEIFENIRKKIDEKINSARSTVETVVDTIKRAFDFSWSLPELKVPHIELDGGEAPWGLGGNGRLPSFDVKWNAVGGIMTKPTLFGAAGGKLLGGGEAGPEAILPLDRLWKELGTLFAYYMNKPETADPQQIIISSQILSHETDSKSETETFRDIARELNSIISSKTTDIRKDVTDSFSEVISSVFKETSNRIIDSTLKETSSLTSNSVLREIAKLNSSMFESRNSEKVESTESENNSVLKEIVKLNSSVLENYSSEKAISTESENSSVLKEIIKLNDSIFESRNSEKIESTESESNSVLREIMKLNSSILESHNSEKAISIESEKDSAFREIVKLNSLILKENNNESVTDVSENVSSESSSVFREVIKLSDSVLKEYNNSVSSDTTLKEIISGLNDTFIKSEAKSEILSELFRENNSESKSTTVNSSNSAFKEITNNLFSSVLRKFSEYSKNESLISKETTNSILSSVLREMNISAFEKISKISDRIFGTSKSDNAFFKEAYERDSINNSVTVTSDEHSLVREASKLFEIDDFSLGSMAGGTTIIYDFSGFTWKPEVNVESGTESDTFMNQLRNHEHEFFDWLEEFVKAREASYYA